MKQEKSLIRIREFLARFKYEVNIANANAQLDINIVAEDILIPVLNIAYNCDLKNANSSEGDMKFPALDLLDKTNRIAFQVTSTSTIRKVRKTLEGIVKNAFYQQFDNFYIYIITQKQKSYDKTILATATQSHFTFTEKNVIDERDLYVKIAALPLDDIIKVEEILAKQFSDIVKSENNTNKNLSEIIQHIQLDYENKYLADELNGSYETREAWQKKKMFFEKQLPMITDINQQFSAFQQIEKINDKIAFYNEQITTLLNQISK
ncbi:MAG: SMEK domain-containing protein [Chitinophagales bacterium]